MKTIQVIQEIDVIMHFLKFTGIIVILSGLITLSKFFTIALVYILEVIIGLDIVDPGFGNIVMMALILEAIPGVLIVIAGIVIYDKRLIFKIRNKINYV